MVWDGNTKDWGRTAAQMIYRPGFRIEIPLMFKDPSDPDFWLPMSRSAMKRVFIEVSRLGAENDRLMSYHIESNKPMFPLGDALFALKGYGDSINRSIQTIKKAEIAAVEGDRKVVNLHE